LTRQEHSMLVFYFLNSCYRVSLKVIVMIMPSLKELMKQRKTGNKISRSRVSIVHVLLAFGFFLVFTVLAIASIGPRLRFLMLWMIAFAIFFFVMYIILAIRFNRAKTSEEEKKKGSTKSTIGSFVFISILIALIFFGLSFFIQMSSEFHFPVQEPKHFWFKVRLPLNVFQSDFHSPKSREKVGKYFHFLGRGNT